MTQHAGAWDVRPGIGLGPINLGADRTQVRHIMGVPSRCLGDVGSSEPLEHYFAIGLVLRYELTDEPGLDEILLAPTTSDPPEASYLARGGVRVFVVAGLPGLWVLTVTLLGSA